METKFKIFNCEITDTYKVVNDVNLFLKSREEEGFTITDKKVHVTEQGPNPLIKPTILVFIWMVKDKMVI